ncbi:hypothetical protein [Streptomyces omiyaensis]|uniref:hypothetical protein n=1 Tax=Streptomyces omiyaensis TaxID=68247 RepID=UPI0036FBE8B0
MLGTAGGDGTVLDGRRGEGRQHRAHARGRQGRRPPARWRTGPASSADGLSPSSASPWPLLSATVARAYELADGSCDRRKAEDQAALFVEHTTWQRPTLILVRTRQFAGSPERTGDPRRRCMAPGRCVPGTGRRGSPPDSPAPRAGSCATTGRAAADDRDLRRRRGPDGRGFRRVRDGSRWSRADLDAVLERVAAEPGAPWARGFPL